MDEPVSKKIEYAQPPKLIDDVPEVEVKEEPKVGDAGYDWSTHYDTKDLYTYTFPNGKVVALKSFKSIYSKTWLFKMRELATNVDVEMAAIERAACPTAMEVLLTLPDDTDEDYIADLFTAWTASGTSRGDGDKGLTPGE